MNRKRIGVYGGTFNPPHKGHVFSAEMMADRLSLDVMYVVPDSVPPHKDLPEGTPDSLQRMEMTRLAFESVPCTVISDIEVSRDGKSYTIDTIEGLMAENPGAEMYLLMGTDMFLTLESWHRGDELLRLVTPVVAARSDEDMEAIRETAKKYRSKYGAESEVMQSVLDVSSTQIRDELKIRRGCAFLPESVYSYIVENRLYGVQADFDWLRSKAYAMLQLKRIPHVAGCEQEAVHLAQTWGVAVDLAREAAILHDITKKLNEVQQLRLCEEYGIMLDNLEKESYKLLHSKTGAAIAKMHFAVSEEVYNAIDSHTTGKPDMTDLEKIIYLADYIEPNRDFEGLDRLREWCYMDLNRAMILGLQMSIDDMHERGIEPHPRSLAALEFLRDKE